MVSLRLSTTDYRRIETLADLEGCTMAGSHARRAGRQPAQRHRSSPQAGLPTARVTTTGQRRVDVESLRARARRPVLREAISDRNPCPKPRGRCPCRTLRGNLHCPLPDHPDRNPSCSVTDGRPALWHCHACDVGGDLVTLLEVADGLNRGDALDVAARMVGAERNERPYRLPKRRPRRERVENPHRGLTSPEPEPSPTTRNPDRRPSPSSGALVSRDSRRRHPRILLPGGPLCVPPEAAAPASRSSPLGHHRRLETAGSPTLAGWPAMPARRLRRRIAVAAVGPRSADSGSVRRASTPLAVVPARTQEPGCDLGRWATHGRGRAACGAPTFVTAARLWSWRGLSTVSPR